MQAFHVRNEICVCLGKRESYRERKRKEGKDSKRKRKRKTVVRGK